VRIAAQPVGSDAALFIAADRGHFQREGLDVELVIFTNTSEMVPALATEQVDAAGLSPNAALWNAAARGVDFKIVLDRGSLRRGSSFAALVIRKDVWDAGRGRRLEDLRGLTLAFTPPGKATSSGAVTAAALQRVGMSLDDLTIQPLPFPDMVPALANGAVDGAALTEPFLTRALRQGSAVNVMGQDEMYPNFTVGVVCFSPTLYTNRPVARALVRAYIRAIRDYQVALSGRAGEADRAQIEEIVARHTGLEPATVREMVPVGFSPNGLPDRGSIVYAYEFFRDQGLVPAPLSEAAIATLLGFDVVEETLAEIGRQPES
jgi:NitT/TauT family transport system substrate-binding protein